ncbi:MAG: ferredoxin (4Fe-4S iron-sulfur cluster binding protein) [Gammaproteobacteria bacterium]|nr:ferredoxin (4Fe-4S iron-sulfur cluster binding protein) [Gammaproteobacteria bacterium]
MNARKQKQSGFRVSFEPSGQRVTSLPGETLLDCARRAGVRITSVCGGRGLCKTCVIRVTEGPVNPPSAADEEYFSKREIDDNWRRSCQTFLAGDCTVTVSARAQAVPTRTEVESEDIYVHPDPVVRAIRGTVPAGTLIKPVGDDKRLKATLNEKWPGAGHTIDIAVLKTMPEILRQANGRVDAVSRFGEIIGLLPQKKGPLLGLAIDVGTTNIGAWLVDLRNGRTLKTMGFENPQSPHGADVITRLGYARKSPVALQKIQNLVMDSLNEAATTLTGAYSLKPEQIADVVIAGNTAMHHLLIGLPVTYLAVVPFIPAVSGAVDIKARDLGLRVMPGAYVHLLPNIAGFVGGDHTAVLLAIDSSQEQHTVVVLDIGTNTEISLIHQGKLASVSCSSGPAFEGGHIRCGMRSAPGAIEKVKIRGNEVELQTIDNQPPIGICGSGVLDMVAELHLAGIITLTGKMNDGHPRVRRPEGKRDLEFVLVDEAEGAGDAIVFTQSDVRSVQLAKGAIRAAIQVLLEDAEITEAQLHQVTIAGAFGSYIDIGSSIAIGMLPDLPQERYAQIGNAAGIGAKLALVSHSHRSEAEAIANRCNYIELAGSKRFNKLFMQSMCFPKIVHNQTNEV